MSYADYQFSKKIGMQDYPFYAIVMAAMRQADTHNLAALRHAWPQVWDELQARYNAPGGSLPDELLAAGAVPRGNVTAESAAELLTEEER
jgi:hypothetical protein